MESSTTETFTLVLYLAWYRNETNVRSGKARKDEWRKRKHFDIWMEARFLKDTKS